jgi:hypothetical protein
MYEVGTAQKFITLKSKNQAHIKGKAIPVIGREGP